MRTLGLSPHLVLKNLGNYSERSIDLIQQEMQCLDDAESFVIEDYAEGKPRDYADLDQKSRFRIISTSPSLDDRIKSNSCVQIQHVSSEMFLSYDTKATFKFKPTKMKSTSGFADEKSVNVTK